jgi:hypothetical protein
MDIAERFFNLIIRNKGDFYWYQSYKFIENNIKSLYIAMFDEIDEGTAIFKCLRENELPINGTKKFVGLDNNLDSDYYLWLTGKAGNWFRGGSGYSSVKPVR